MLPEEATLIALVERGFAQWLDYQPCPGWLRKSLQRRAHTTREGEAAETRSQGGNVPPQKEARPEAAAPQPRGSLLSCSHRPLRRDGSSSKAQLDSPLVPHTESPTPSIRNQRLCDISPGAEVLWAAASCGRQLKASSSGLLRVVGGTNAAPGTWPWIVSLQRPWGKRTKHFCGGSLINPQWVLTAAHCFDKFRKIAKWRVVIGTTKLSQLGPEAQVRRIKRLLRHEAYWQVTAENDIAVLELDQPIQCNEHVQLACLPQPDDVKLSELKNCQVAGWGSTVARSTEPEISDVLQEAKVHLIDTKLCNSSQWYTGAVHSYNLCAGYPQGGIDTCQGDSGGPLACQDSHADYYWVVGLTSWGKGCAREKQPGIYTSTQHFYNWILEHMGRHQEEAAAPPLSQPVSTSAPSQTPRPGATQPGSSTSCAFACRKALKFLSLLWGLLRFLMGKGA
ncbi:acrosin-like [Colius striatus]|uniref:acrosin-like n=1 Tax=Colius striatus TaxID=57412 RepID=UPI002B1DDDAB|nr:acrosin-like [Colius striatus]XP_061875887.1 acrosin-like [Colius striatus]XP_061875898.1 acrosin-like [Colius striatus]